MFIFLLNCLTIAVLVVLGIFSTRRMLFLSTAIFSKLDWELKNLEIYLPFITILIPCHNEESVISETLSTLLTIKYPWDKLEIVVIDDLSSDNTLRVIQEYEKKYPHVHAFQRSKDNRKRGKSAALNEALSKCKRGEIVYSIDADHRLRPDALLRLVRHFSNPKIGAVSGRCVPWNKYDSLISGYVFLESLVHHRVTMYASDRLKLAPGILGSNFCIKRSLLEKIGLFNENALTEDIDLTAFIYENGYIVKYDVTGITEHEAPGSIKSYILQHLRWNRGFNKVARSHWRRILKNNTISLPRRIELTLFSLGYVDRIFLFAAFSLTLLSLLVLPAYHFPFWAWLFILGPPAFEILAAIFVEGERAAFYLRLPLILSMFSVDIFVALRGFYQDLIKKPTQWYKTPRVYHHSKVSGPDSTSQE